MLSAMSEHEGVMLEKTSLRWPLTLRRCFLSGLYFRKRKRWPYTPYRAATQFGSKVKRSEIAAAFGLRATFPGSSAI